MKPEHQLDRLYEEAGRRLAAGVWSDRIYWPLMGVAKYREYRDRAWREGDPIEKRMRIREWLRPDYANFPNVG